MVWLMEHWAGLLLSDSKAEQYAPTTLFVILFQSLKFCEYDNAWIFVTEYGLQMACWFQDKILVNLKGHATPFIEKRF